MLRKPPAAVLVACLPLAWIAPAMAQTSAAPTVAAAPAGDSAAELAKKLANPISSLISLPLQNNFDFGSGAEGDGFQYKLKFTLTLLWPK